MSYQYLQVMTANKVTTITLNRPDKRNALHGELVSELASAITVAANDPQTRVVMIRGQGSHFCAGADIGWMQHIAGETAANNLADAKSLASLMYQLYSFPKPTVALAHGTTLGGGLGLLAAADIAIASENTRFRFSETKIGITPATISPYVIAAIGERMARYYFLTCEQFDAREAHRIGLVHQVVSDDALLSAGEHIAQTLLQHSPHALTAAKELIQTVSHATIDDGLIKKTAELLARIRSTEEAREGLQSFLEKRTPNWS